MLNSMHGLANKTVNMHAETNSLYIVVLCCLQTIVRTGAVDVVVPGVLPIGCFPIYLTLYGTSNAADYDGDGCLKSYNALSSYHNGLLRRSLANLQKTYPHARIMYADFYSQVIHMIRAPQNFGETTLSAFLICFVFFSSCSL
jgi:hypothetical protein